MTRPIENSRNNCALHGAIQTALAIKGVIPIIHSTTGCGLQQYLGGSRVSGCNGSGYVGGLATPSSNVIERQVIFGGTSRLREQIKNSVKLIEGDLYVVLSGCATELVGDDIPAMTKEAQEQGYPVVYVNTPGFRGDVHSGYELLVKGLIEQIDKFTTVTTGKISGLVNVFGIIPGQDVFWQGNLLELKRILEAIGLKVNTLFGYDEGINAWQQIPNAELNLVFSPWGINIAKQLEVIYQTPFLDLNNLPVGVEDSSLLLHIVGEKLNLDRKIIEQIQQLEEKSLAYYLEKIADAYFDYDFQKEFALVGESSWLLSLARFLIMSGGLIPKIFIVTDNPTEEYRQFLTEEIKYLVPNISPEIVFTEDGGRINDLIRQSKVELILGSSLEKKVARELKVPLHQVSFPITDKVVLSKSYIGYRGPAALLEDLSQEILAMQNQKAWESQVFTEENVKAS